MFNNLIVFVASYFLIIISILGYGLFFLKIFKNKDDEPNFGYAGLVGIFIILIYSYLSNLFLPHSIFHNTIFILFGFLIFFTQIINYERFKKEILLTFVIFSLLFISLLISKNHDDFTYYHFPYTYYLTQESAAYGIGKFNYGFRTPSSIFYLNSLFYLPFIKYYSFNFAAVLFLGFANILLLKKISPYFISFKLKKINNYKINYINYLSLFSLIFINIFFYRIAEHGTDRSAQILVLIFVITILESFDKKNLNQIDIFFIYILLGLILSLKAFFILYAILIIPIIVNILKIKSFQEVIKLIFINKYFILLFIFTLLIMNTYFMNTGCLLYPVSFTCLDNLEWSLTSKEAIRMNNWYEAWSKAGASPTYRIENLDIYIQKFNWLGNWIDNYFFNKVSDFILGLILLNIIIIYAFYNKKKNTLKINFSIVLLYILILVLFFEWFYNHPSLRYGGFCILALIVFLPSCLYLNSFKINKEKYMRNTTILLIITLMIFYGRNINRLNKEIDQYKYKPINTTFYEVTKNDFRIKEITDKIYKDYLKCKEKNQKCKPEKLKINKFKIYINSK